MDKRQLFKVLGGAVVTMLGMSVAMIAQAAPAPLTDAEKYVIIHNGGGVGGAGLSSNLVAPARSHGHHGHHGHGHHGSGGMT